MVNTSLKVQTYSKNKFKPVFQKPAFQTTKGLSKKVVEEISWQKNEPAWMREKRLVALTHFQKKPMPSWGPDLSGLDLKEITFFSRVREAAVKYWRDVPKEIRKVYEKIGIPEAEQKFLGGVVAQFESESIYESIRKQWQKLGVIFCSMDTAIQKYPDLVKPYFMTRCVPVSDNKFTALHGAVWSGGSFVYVPSGVTVTVPLQTYFWMNDRQAGQFEHTLIIVEEGAQVHYIEGCTAPYYTTNSLHSAVVEIFVKTNAKARYTTIQNWSTNVYNLNTKRAAVEGEEAAMEWVGGSLGSGITMLYPCSILKGRAARADHLNIALAGKGQIKDTGAKVIHAAPFTSSRVVSKSISKDGGWSTYRGLLKINKGAHHAKSSVRCDALILDDQSRSDTWPYLEVDEKQVTLGHEATVGRIDEEQFFYLRSRGLSKSEALGMMVNGFIEPVIKELPLEYSVELNRLIQLEMEGSVG